MASATRTYEVLDTMTGESIVVTDAPHPVTALRVATTGRFRVSVPSAQRAFQLGAAGAPVVSAAGLAEEPAEKQPELDPVL